MFDKEYIAHRREGNGKIQNLSLHLEEVSQKAGEFASKIGLKECGQAIGLLHDLGKASDEFERYIKSAVGLIDSDNDDYVDASEKKGKIDHSSAGAQLIFRNIANKGIAQVLSLCIASHHSGLIDCVSPQGIDVYSKRMNKPEDRAHTSEVLSKLSDSDKKRIMELVQSQEIIKHLLDKFQVLATEKDSLQTRDFKRGLLVRFLFSCLIDADRLSTADFEHPHLAKLRNNNDYEIWPVLIDRLENELKHFKAEGINAIRQKISRECHDFAVMPKGLYQLTVPTGGGKTLASLRFALHHADKYKIDKIIYILPYTTIIDQNAGEIRKILESDNKSRNKIVLEHHSNLMPEKETARQKILSENWDAPVILTTSVQFFEALFAAGTRGARRMHQLANAVIIFDEVQAMPIKCVHMFNVAVNFLVNYCNSTVVLCTATQPLLDKVEPRQRALIITGQQQMVADTKQIFSDLKRIEVFDERKPGGWGSEEITDLIAQRRKEFGSVLVVVNTKKSAQEIYNQCKQIKKVKLYHLSASMCPAHRMEKLDTLLKAVKNKKPVICVSTQLIEAGVDISFGAIIRYLAGLDSIAQAAGRCNRHNEFYPALGKVSIINPTQENLDSLEDIRVGKEKAERVLDEYKTNPERFEKNLLGIEAMRQYYQYYFYERSNDMSYPVNADSAVGRADNLFNLLSVNELSIQEYARVNRGKILDIVLRQAFMSAAKVFQAIEITARGVIVPYGKIGKEIINKLCSVKELDKQYKLIKQAQRYSVNVFPDILEKLQKNEAVYEAQEGSGILCLDEQYYSEEFGLSEKSINEMQFLSDK